MLIVFALTCASPPVPEASLDAVCVHTEPLPLVHAPPKPWDARWQWLMVDDPERPDVTVDTGREILIIAGARTRSEVVLDAIGRVHEAGAGAVWLAAASDGVDARWPLVDPSVGSGWLPRTRGLERDYRHDQVQELLRDDEGCTLPEELVSTSLCDDLESWKEAIAGCADAHRDRLATLAQVRAVLDGRGALPTAVRLRLDRSAEPFHADSLRTPWHETLSAIRDADSSWATYPLEGFREDCSRVRTHEARLGLVRDDSWETVEASLPAAFAVLGATPGQGLLQTHPGHRFWAGDADIELSYGQPSLGVARVRPAGCAVYGLSDGDTPAIDWVKGEFEIEVELPHLSFETRQAARLPVPTVDQPLVNALFHLRPSLVSAVSDALERMPPGDERLALLQGVQPFFSLREWRAVARHFEPSEGERHFVEFGNPDDFVVKDATTLFGVLPMTVQLDGRSLPVEPLPRSETSDLEQLGRVVIPGSGTGRLTVTTGAHDVREAIVSYQPGSWADFSHVLVDTSASGGCVVTDRRAMATCGQWESPGTPLLVNDAACAAGGGFTTRQAVVTALRFDDGENTRVPVLHLADGVLSVTHDGRRLRHRRIAGACRR